MRRGGPQAKVGDFKLQCTRKEPNSETLSQWTRTGCGEKDWQRKYSVGLDIAEGSHRRRKRRPWRGEAKPVAAYVSLVYRSQLPSGNDPRSWLSTLGPVSPQFDHFSTRSC